MIEIDDPEVIEAYARREVGLHIYELGDLDPFFWPHTRWYGLPDADGRGLAALVLLYGGSELPCLLALARGPSPAHDRLLRELAPRLPVRFYAHLGPGLAAVLRDALGPGWRVESGGHHLKLVLAGDDALTAIDDGEVEALGPAQQAELEALYARSYPGNWFDARMLETGQYVGIRREGTLACVAGVHVYAPRQGVAALGNVTTDPAWRGRGLATVCVAGLCKRLRRSCEVIGLNVHHDNAAALACYRKLGFVELAGYDEYGFARTPTITSSYEPSGERLG